MDNDNDQPDPPPTERRGPDIITGDVSLCQQLGRTGPIGSGTIGMGCDTLACNIGDENLNWRPLPDIEHPVIYVNMYRLREIEGSDRIEQIGYSWLKHVFSTEPDERDGCGRTCQPSERGDEMGPGCRDAYLAEQFWACDLGPRSSVNPYMGALPGGESLGQSEDCATNYPSRNHLAHVHTELSHRVQIKEQDLGSGRFFAEGGYISAHEYREGNGNQNNNVSFREIVVEGPDESGTYTFTEAGEPVTEAPAVFAWEGAESSTLEPEPAVDGYAIVAFKVTPRGDGLWHYEYAIQNVNLDRGIRLFRLPLPAEVQISSAEFQSPWAHAPELHADNYSDAPWQFSNTGEGIEWATDPYAVDRLSNAIRWGTLYNFRFDANRPPQRTEAVVGYFKTEESESVSVLGPG